MSGSFEIENNLVALSHNLADVVEQVGACVVAVKAQGQGRFSPSGIHWRPGVIVTAEETIHSVEQIEVTLPDNRTLTATLAGRDRSTDIAVFKLETLDLPVAQIGESSSLRVGNLVLAVGRSAKNGVNASLGIVNALGGAWQSSYGGSIDQFIGLALNFHPNLEGGALVEATGRVIGMTVSGPRRSILAIPSNTINRVVDRLLEKGQIGQGYLGLGMQPVHLPEKLKNSLSLSSGDGLIVVNVEPNSPADEAGVTLGDIIVTLSNTPTRNIGDVRAILSSEIIGQPLLTEIIRGGALVKVNLVPTQKA